MDLRKIFSTYMTRKIPCWTVRAKADPGRVAGAPTSPDNGRWNG